MFVQTRERILCLTRHVSMDTYDMFPIGDGNVFPMCLERCERVPTWSCSRSRHHWRSTSVCWPKYSTVEDDDSCDHVHYDVLSKFIDHLLLGLDGLHVEPKSKVKLAIFDTTRDQKTKTKLSEMGNHFQWVRVWTVLKRNTIKRRCLRLHESVSLLRNAYSATWCSYLCPPDRIFRCSVSSGSISLRLLLFWAPHTFSFSCSNFSIPALLI